MARRAGISQEELRRANVSALLSWVHAHGPTSRAVLTTELGLNRSTIGDLTSQLESMGLVSEGLPVAERRSGRPSLVRRRPPDDGRGRRVDTRVREHRMVFSEMGAF